MRLARGSPMIYILFTFAGCWELYCWSVCHSLRSAVPSRHQTSKHIGHLSGAPCSLPAPQETGRIHFYRLSMNLPEGSVLSLACLSVILSVHGGGGTPHVTTVHDSIGQSRSLPYRYPSSCSNLFTMSPDICQKATSWYSTEMTSSL